MMNPFKQIAIVGTGQGDHDYLTHRAFDYLQQADIVLYDCLADEITLSVWWASAYQSFHLKPGMKVNARVRKKGCAGNEIFELLHPVCSYGKEYSFRVEGSGSLPFNNEMLNF